MEFVPCIRAMDEVTLEVVKILGKYDRKNFMSLLFGNG